MPPITYNPDTIPEGTYLCKFTGVKVVEIENSQFGSGPRYEWRFQIFGGKEGGRDITQLSGLSASSPKSTAFKLMHWFLGRMPTKGESFDPDHYIGRWFRVKWALNPESKQGRCHIFSLEQAEAPPAGSPSAFPPRPPAPPAPPGAPTPPPPPTVLGSPAPRYWVLNEEGQVESEPVPEQEVRERVNAGELLQLTDEAQTSGWKPAKEWGFEQDIPF